MSHHGAEKEGDILLRAIFRHSGVGGSAANNTP